MLWVACRCCAVIMGPLTHIVQPLDLHFNAKFKQLIDKLTLLAPFDAEHKKYFVSKSGKSKSGHQLVTIQALEDLLKTRWPMSYRSEDMQAAYDKAGWTLNPLKETEKDKDFLSHYFKCRIGEPLPSTNLQHVVRKIDISRESLSKVLEKSSTPGRKPTSIGLGAYKFCGQMVRNMMRDVDKGVSTDVYDQYHFQMRLMY